MIKTSRQLKDLIRNLSKEKKADAQILMRTYMMERLLERISLSAYKNKFILKGGMLVADMVGLDVRSTMDMDATIKGDPVNVNSVADIMTEILDAPIDDRVEFYVKRISEIMDDAEYPGIRVSLETLFDGVRTPLKVDISTGDVITPREIRYSFKMMFEERRIEVWAYNLETVLAEKLETLIVRTITNTRMRDFYDIHILMQLYGKDLKPNDFRSALLGTTKKRGSEKLIAEAETVFDDIENSPVMQRLWSLYKKKFSYAANLSWTTVIQSVRELYGIGKNM